MSHTQEIAGDHVQTRILVVDDELRTKSSWAIFFQGNSRSA